MLMAALMYLSRKLPFSSKKDFSRGKYKQLSQHWVPSAERKGMQLEIRKPRMNPIVSEINSLWGLWKWV
ncbi:MAG: hypothetical protein CMQ45_00270 [Gammaproteobacteria bacterium]|nr:hypothetical protein [Gammaproteobacteria bacterium]